MQKILIPTDFSNNAFKAIYYSMELAQRSGADIFLLHVIEPALDFAKMQEVSSNEQMVDRISSELIALHKTLTSMFPGVKVTKHLSGGTPVESIVKYAEVENIDLIVMGTSGASGLKEFFIGSVASGVISKADIPVLTIPASYEPEEPDAILLATNLFEKDRTILQKVISLSKKFYTTVHVVVFKEMNGDKNADFIYNEEQLNNYLKFLKESFPDTVFKGALLEGEDFELTIDRYCNEHEVDVIAMVHYPKTFFEKLLKKSMTRSMSLHSTTPVLAIPAIRKLNL